MLSNNLNGSQRSTEARKLISSIEKNISKLIDDKPESLIINSFEHSGPLQFSHQSNIPSMNIHELESSIKRSNPMSERVSEKINRMEDFYVDKIKRLEYKISQLEQTNHSLNEKVHKLTSDLLVSQQQKFFIADQIKTSQNTRIQNMEQVHLQMLQSIKIQLQAKLSSQKLCRLSLQGEIQKLIQQNRYLKQSHKLISLNYRKLLKADMGRMKEQIDQQNKQLIIKEIKSVKDKNKRLRERSKVIDNVIPQVQKQMKSIRKKLRQL